MKFAPSRGIALVYKHVGKLFSTSLSTVLPTRDPELLFVLRVTVLKIVIGMFTDVMKRQIGPRRGREVLCGWLWRYGNRCCL